MKKKEFFATDNPKLKKRRLSDGNDRLYLEYYLGYKEEYNPVTDKKVIKPIRKVETLKLMMYGNPRTPSEREQNNQTWELAKQIRYKREQEFKENREGYSVKTTRQGVNFLDFFQRYIDEYTKKDQRVLRMALNSFKQFLSCEDNPEYNKFATYIKPKDLTKDMMVDFTDYLKSTRRGEGAKTIFQRFKKVINYAIEHDVMQKNPCKGVSILVDCSTYKKAFLSAEEVEALIKTHYDKENPVIRNAFLFCLYTGMRFCDVKELTFADVDYSNRLLRYEQNKTREHSTHSNVILPLNDGLLEMIGKPEQEKQDGLIFKLPSHNMCNKALGHWCERAGIKKHITWHCGRHSFATLSLTNGANMKVIQELLGHSSLEYTQRYVRAIDNEKRKAVDSLPKITF